MNNDTPVFSSQDSLKLIEQMIGRARAEEKESGKGWIIWGWLLFLASVVHYLMIRTGMPNGNIVWIIFGIAAVFLALYEMVLKKYVSKKDAKATTYTHELVNRLGIAFFISLMVIVYGNIQLDLNASGVNFGYLLVLYAFWLFIHGSAFRFRLFIIGAIINWVGALIIFYWKESLGAEVLLVHAFCVAMGYLIPGHIAFRKYGKSDSFINSDQGTP
jgi:hypothetical protein